MKRLVLFVLTLIASFAVKGTNVSGTVLVDTHWTLSGSPYTLIGIFGVNTGATLTIDPGVQVNGNYDLIIIGKIIVNGDNGNTVKFQDTRLLFKKASLSLSSIEYTEFNHGGVQLADETEFIQDNPKNSGMLLLKNCTFANGAYAYTKGYHEFSDGTRLRIENSAFTDSFVLGYYPRSEIIELDHVTMSNSTVESDAYNFGIKISNSTVTGSQVSMKNGGASLDISNSTFTSSSIGESIMSTADGLLNLTSTSMTDTYISLPRGKLMMTNCDVDYSLSRSYVIEMGYGTLKNSNIKGTANQNLVRVTGHRGTDLAGPAIFDKVDFKDCNTAVEVTDSPTASFFHCNFFNPSQYAINNQSAANINAKSNYWGTTTDATIQNLIYDLFDNINKGIVDYSNLLTSKALFTPVITWNTPASVNYGSALSAAQLNASADIPGTLTYTPPIGTMLNAGVDQALNVNFIPTDLVNYYPTTAQVSLTVNKASQAIIFGSIPPKSFGDAAFSLTASSSSGLTVGFTSASDKIQISGNQVSILKPGRVAISATQAGSNNYNAATTVTQTFCVAPAKPTITIANPNSFPLLTSSAATGNQWYANDAAIEGATAQTFTVKLSGSYKLLVTADDCVSAFSDVLPLSITGDLHTPQSLIVYPVPAIDFIEIQGLTEDIQIANVITMTGHTIPVQLERSGSNRRINTEMLSTGMYILNIHEQDKVYRIKFAVQ